MLPGLRLPSIFRRVLFLVMFVAVLCVDSASAQKNQPNTASPPKYDLKTEAKMNGTVEELKLPAKGSEKEPAHLLLKNGTETVDVYLCPKSFLDDMGISFKKGDDIALTGSKVKQDAADIILAREIVKGDGYARSSR